MSRQRGVFITLEGVEGAGKTSSMTKIRDRLRASGPGVVCTREPGVVCTREPGGTPLAESIREVMLSDWAEGMPLMTELLLVFAARAAHLENAIRPALARGDWVVCDRFTDATYAYQGAARGMGGEIVSLLETRVQGDLRPDHVLVFDLPVEQGMARARQRGQNNRFDRERMEFMQAVRACYLERAHAEPSRYHVIDAGQGRDAVDRELHILIDDILRSHGYA